MTAEIPELRVEEQYLEAAGLQQYASLEIKPGVPLGSFLDAYPPNSPHRDTTEGALYQWLYPDSDEVGTPDHVKLGEDLMSGVMEQIRRAGLKLDTDA